jgi:hypothetical protein
MNAAQFRKERYGLSFIIGASLLSILPLPLGAYAATTPAPKISVSPASVNFSPLKVGGTSSKTVTIRNTGTLDLLVDSANITFTGTDLTQFSQTNTCTSALAQNATCTVSVTFTPTTFGKKNAMLNIPSNDPKKLTATVKLSGQAPPPVISANPMSVNLTAPSLDTPSAAATVRIKNTGVSDLNISSANITGTNASLFAATNNCTSPIPKGESCTVDVTFTPVSTGTKNASLVIDSDAVKKSELTVKLTGKINKFTTADLAGTWTGSILNTVAGTPGTQMWSRMTINVNANGSFTGTEVRSDGNSDNVSGKLSISSDGKYTVLGLPNFMGYMDAGKTVLAFTSTPDPGITQLGVFTTNNGASYALTDLAGTWNGNFVSAGTGTNSWTRMAINIDSSGSVTGGTSVDSTGTPGTPSGNFSITSDGGILTWSAEPNMLCSMDAGKTVIACTDAPGSGIVDMAVFTKTGASFTLADLAGTWAVNSLATGPSAPCWIRVTLTAKPDGTFTDQEINYDGTTNKKKTKTGSGTWQITSDGLIINVGKDSNFLCQVDANETVISCTETWDDGSTALTVLTRKLK